MPSPTPSTTTSTLPSTAEGDTISGYKVGATLGVGSFAIVKVGTHARDPNRRVALKLLFSHAQSQQLVREVAIMQRIRHDHVVRLISFRPAVTVRHEGQASKCALTVLELCNNGELFDFLVFSGRFGERLTRHYAAQMIAGVRAIHRAGFVHRDLKPENVLFDHRFRLKIADFGLATPIRGKEGHVRTLHTKCGTREYFAPEVFRGRYGKEVDVFAVGLLVFTMFAGFPPFQVAQTTDWWWARLEEGRPEYFWKAHEREATFPLSFRELVETLLHPNRHKRGKLRHVARHPWMLENIPMTDAEVVTAMKNRRSKVEQARQRKVAGMERKAMASWSSSTSTSTTTSTTTTSSGCSRPSLSPSEVHS